MGFPVTKLVYQATPQSQQILYHTLRFPLLLNRLSIQNFNSFSSASANISIIPFSLDGYFHAPLDWSNSWLSVAFIITTKAFHLLQPEVRILGKFLLSLSIFLKHVLVGSSLPSPPIFLIIPHISSVYSNSSKSFQLNHNVFQNVIFVCLIVFLTSAWASINWIMCWKLCSFNYLQCFIPVFFTTSLPGYPYMVIPPWYYFLFNCSFNLGNRLCCCQYYNLLYFVVLCF